MMQVSSEISHAPATAVSSQLDVHLVADRRLLKSSTDLWNMRFA